MTTFTNLVQDGVDGSGLDGALTCGRSGIGSVMLQRSARETHRWSKSTNQNEKLVEAAEVMCVAS